MSGGTKARLKGPWCLGKRYVFVLKQMRWCTNKYANADVSAYANMRISWPYSLPMIGANTQTCFLCRNSYGVCSGTRRGIQDQDGSQAIQVPNCTTGNCSSHKIKALLNGNAIIVKLLSQFTGYSSAGKQSKPGRRPCGQQNSGLPQIWLVHINCSFFEC